MSFGQIALLIGGSFLGVFMGHTIIRSIFGTGSSRQQAPQHYQQPAPPAPCQSEADQLGQCIEFASKDITKCQIYMDILKQCQQRTTGYQA